MSSSANRQEISPYNLRDESAEEKYHFASECQDKANKVVAHYFALELAAYFYNHVYPRVDIATMIRECNATYNLNMVHRNTYLITHKKQNDKMIESFEKEILPIIATDDHYQNLLKSKPIRLQHELKQNGVTRIELKYVVANRARVQAKRVQKLNFPNHYKAFGRFFYSCFTDSNGEKIWDDEKNTKDFKRDLDKERKHRKSHWKCSECTFDNPKEEAICECCGIGENPKPRNYSVLFTMHYDY